MDTKAMYKLSYGLFVVTTVHDGKFNGCISNTAIQVANDPTRLGIAINKANLTHDLVKAAGKFNVSIISEEADFELFKHFGMQSGRDVDKFLGYKDCAGAANGIPYITKGINAVMCCTVTEMFDLGSHTFFVATIDDMKVLSDADSATYAYYQSSIKPQPGKPADPADPENPPDAPGVDEPENPVDRDYPRYVDSNSKAADIKILQDRLIELGYLPPPSNGLYSYWTRECVKQFQERVKLPKTGTADEATMDALFASDAPRFR
jgi:flavin reductase (DIM6/NTAB) family NADH-FMN oxidoreductase RutF